MLDELSRAAMLESMKLVAATEVPPRHRVRSMQDNAVRFARSCYDHLAGQAGVAITDALVDLGYIVLTDEGGEVTPLGEQFFHAFGADVSSAHQSRRLFCRPLPRLERASLLHQRCCRRRNSQRLLELDWFRRIPQTRALALTPRGRAELSNVLLIQLNDDEDSAPTIALARPDSIALSIGTIPTLNEQMSEPHPRQVACNSSCHLV